MRQQGIHGGANGAAREQDVIHKHDVEALHGKLEVGGCGTKRLIVAAEVIPEEGNVQVTTARRGTA